MLFIIFQDLSIPTHPLCNLPGPFHSSMLFVTFQDLSNSTFLFVTFQDLSIPLCYL